MHTNGNSMNINPATFYSVGNGEKFAPERAAAVRRRLLKNSSILDDAATPEESLLLGHWLEANPGPLASPAQEDSDDISDPGE